GLNRVFILDAVSALAGEYIDIAGSKIYMVAGTAGKCIQGFPGVSFVLVRKGFLERMRSYPKRSWYLHLTHYVDDQGRGVVPCTWICPTTLMIRVEVSCRLPRRFKSIMPLTRH